MYPRHRLDGLADAIYGVSMTLLVLDIRVPDLPAGEAGLAPMWQAIWPHLLPYLISFVVLSSGWLAAIRVPHRGASASAAYVRWWRWHLLLVTLMPFSTMLVARYDGLGPAAMIYAANVGVMSLCAWLAMAAGDAEDPQAMIERRNGLVMIIVLSLGAVALSPWLGARALWLYALKGVVPDRLVQRVLRGAQDAASSAAAPKR